MAPRPQNGFGVFFFVFSVVEGHFCWGFWEIECILRGFWMVNRGEFVVKTWLETTLK
jgi:hypothetical protein